MNLPEKNACWIFHGKGMDSFGDLNAPVEITLPRPGPGELLARVDAFAICASDVKMISMGNDYPLFKDRDFDRHPVILGHELSLTVVAAGSKIASTWPVGKRFGVQPDVYLNNERFCIGVNVPGGMAEYLLLGEEVFLSDHGSCAFPVADELSYAAVAQTEPLACVEAAFVQHSRQHMLPEGRVLIWLDESISQPYRLDLPFVSQNITVAGSRNCFDAYVSGCRENELKYVSNLPDEVWDDMIILGNPDEAMMTQLTERLAVNGLFCWLPQSKPQDYVPMDIAKVHYNKLNLLGAADRTLSTAFSHNKYRYDYQPGGILIISGGAGTMGRIHLLRALKSPRAPANIIVLANTRSRLDRMVADFTGLVASSATQVHYLALQDSFNYKSKIREIVGEQGASDIVVSAPGIEPINNVVEFLADNGTLNLFSGTRYGQFGQLPLGRVAAANVSVIASSGSSVKDQIRVLKKIGLQEAMPDFNVAAIGGLLAAKQGVEAVKVGRFAGKVVIYPQLKSLPLLPLDELDRWDVELGEHVARRGWSREAEIMLERLYKKKCLSVTSRGSR